ncbi:hypothetical protein [Acidianus sp. RZ1]|uniref:hypothetical protein n=1 Tax=Acidianus sp. RZ1 TaxID=1540082 RepID=UPI0014910D35|nr:hypothetical protein [Acidianus sp. RZ1]NON61907.1 hypothetical protein [Acidianus sp. RZ1]
MDWKFSDPKKEKAPPPNVMCEIDEIAESPEVKRIVGKNTGHGSEIHRFVSEVIIKVYKEKKATLEEVLGTFHMDDNLKEELAREVIRQARMKGII